MVSAADKLKRIGKVRGPNPSGLLDGSIQDKKEGTSIYVCSKL